MIDKPSSTSKPAPVVNPRPTFMPDPRPMIVCNDVPGATSYKFKMTNQKTQETLWEIELSSDDMELEDEVFRKSDYPEGKPDLDRRGTYLLTGETNDGTSTLTGQAEVVLLEQTTIDSIADFETSLDSEASNSLKEKWLTAKEATLVFNENFTTDRPWIRSHTRIFLAER